MRALDIANSDLMGDSKVRENAVKMLMGYLTTDTLLCWAPEKKDPSDPSRVSLRSQQKAAADPIIKYLTTHIWPGVELYPALGDDSILPTPQPENTVQAVRSWIRDLPAWELAALERGVLASKSLCVAVRLLVEWSERWTMEKAEGVSDEDNRRNPVDDGDQVRRFTIEDAAEACSLEVKWQTGMWGEVEDTHDVEKEYLRRQLGSVVLLISGGDR